MCSSPKIPESLLSTPNEFIWAFNPNKFTPAKYWIIISMLTKKAQNPKTKNKYLKLINSLFTKNLIIKYKNRYLK